MKVATLITRFATGLAAPEETWSGYPECNPQLLFYQWQGFLLWWHEDCYSCWRSIISTYSCSCWEPTTSNKGCPRNGWSTNTVLQKPDCTLAYCLCHWGSMGCIHSFLVTGDDIPERPRHCAPNFLSTSFFLVLSRSNCRFLGDISSWPQMGQEWCSK